jgi:hypothetical protein
MLIGQVLDISRAWADADRLGAMSLDDVMGTAAVELPVDQESDLLAIWWRLNRWPDLVPARLRL